MPLLQRTRVPGARLCEVIVYFGGQSGENDTLPVKPAFDQADCARLLSRPTRLTTVQRGAGVGVGLGVGLGVGRGVGLGVGAGSTTG
jgi:hypothetical protein